MGKEKTKIVSTITMDPAETEDIVTPELVKPGKTYMDTAGNVNTGSMRSTKDTATASDRITLIPGDTYTIKAGTHVFSNSIDVIDAYIKFTLDNKDKTTQPIEFKELEGKEITVVNENNGEIIKSGAGGYSGTINTTGLGDTVVISIKGSLVKCVYLLPNLIGIDILNEIRLDILKTSEFDIEGTMRQAPSLKSFSLIGNIGMNSLKDMFSKCNSLSNVPMLDLTRVNITDATFIGCTILSNLKIKNLHDSVNISSILTLNVESVEYILNNVINNAGPGMVEPFTLTLCETSPGYKALTTTSPALVSALSKGWLIEPPVTKTTADIAPVETKASRKRK